MWAPDQQYLEIQTLGPHASELETLWVEPAEPIFISLPLSDSDAS